MRYARIEAKGRTTWALVTEDGFQDYGCRIVRHRGLECGVVVGRDEGDLDLRGHEALAQAGLAGDRKRAHGPAVKGAAERHQPVASGHAARTVRISSHHAGIDGKSLATHQTLSHASPQDTFEDIAERIALTKTPVAILRER